MPCKVLVKATTAGTWVKGTPVIVVDDAHLFGTKEGLPDFVVLKITDATKDQVIHFLDVWRTNFQHTVLAQNAEGYRVQITLDPKIITAHGSEQGVKQDIIDYLVEEYGAQVFSISSDKQELVIDIPKPVTLSVIRSEVKDIFEQDVHQRLQYFTDADIDNAVLAGGIVEFTKTQILARIKNKLID